MGSWRLNIESYQILSQPVSTRKGVQNSESSRSTVFISSHGQFSRHSSVHFLLTNNLCNWHECMHLAIRIIINTHNSTHNVESYASSRRGCLEDQGGQGGEYDTRELRLEWSCGFRQRDGDRSSDWVKGFLSRWYWAWRMTMTSYCREVLYDCCLKRLWHHNIKEREHGTFQDRYRRYPCEKMSLLRPHILNGRAFTLSVMAF